MDIVTGIAKTFGAIATIDFKNHFPPTINPPVETELVFATARRVLGNEKVTHGTDPSMASEDFSYFLEKIPGCYFFIGNGLEQGAIHSAQYKFNDEIIPIAAEVMAQVAMDYLNHS